MEPANHHYVPKFYLKGFMDKKARLWVYEHGASAPRESTPKKEGHRPDYYILEGDDAQRDAAEKMFSQAEALAAPVIRKIGNREFKLQPHQRSVLDSFVALMFVRVPAFRDFINQQAAAMMGRQVKRVFSDEAAFHELVREAQEKNGIVYKDLDKLRAYGLSDDLKLTQASNAFNLRAVLRQAANIAEILHTEHSHEIWYAPSGHPFLTGDNPVYTIKRSGKDTAVMGSGFGLKGTDVVFPLNKKACLFLSRSATGSASEVSEHRVRQINRAIMAVSQQFVYASVEQRQLARLFTEQGRRVKYGVNAFVSPQRQF